MLVPALGRGQEDFDGIAPALRAGHAAGNCVARMLGRDRGDLVRGVAMLAAVTGTSVDPGISRAITSSFDLSLPDAERLRHLQRAYFAPGQDARVWPAGWHPEVTRAQRAARAATKDRAWLRAAEMAAMGCVYFSFLGGGAPLHPGAIRAVREVACHDLMAHYRLVRLAIEGLGPVAVGTGPHGNSPFDTLQARARERPPGILQQVAADRGAHAPATPSLPGVTACRAAAATCQLAAGSSM